MGNPPTLKRIYGQGAYCPFCKKLTEQKLVRLASPYFVVKCLVCGKEFCRKR